MSTKRNDGQGLLRNVMNPFLLLLSLYFSLQLGAHAQLAGYQFSKQITIDALEVAGTADLSNFPLYINITNLDLRTVINGGGVTSDDGFDMAFTLADGVTVLDHEIQSYDDATGQFIAWVRIPTLDHNDNTIIYLYYGNSSVTLDPSTTGTWVNYVGVWHLDETGAGAAGEYIDASGSGNDGQGGAGNGLRIPTQTSSGFIGGAQDYDGANDLINCGSDASLDNLTTLTFSAWINPEATTLRRLFEKRALIGEGKNFYITSDTENKLRYVVQAAAGGSELTRLGNPVTLNAWQHVTMTWSGSITATSSVNFYINGAPANEAGGPGSGSVLDDAPGDLVLGNRPAADRTFQGLMDEVRLSNVVRTPAWIQTEYNNQVAPSSFYAVTDATLPIDLVSFEATVDQKEYAVHLTWTTASEESNDFFTIEKSIDSKQWTEVLQWPGAGDSEERLDYQATDTDPFPGLSYYRLKQTDYDGTYSYSSIQAVTLGAHSNNLLIYPNPVESLLHVQAESSLLSELRIFNTAGRDVTSLIEVLEKTNDGWRLNTRGLPAGLYTLRSGTVSLQFIHR